MTTSPATELGAQPDSDTRARRRDDEVRRRRPAVVEVVDATRAFDDNVVLENISLEVPSGEIFGLIGPSGCGKTTLVKLLVGLLAPTDGTVRVLGVEPSNFRTRDREQIGYTPQGFFLYPTLTVHENAKFVASLYGVSIFRRRRRIRDVLTFLEIWDARNRLASDISGGMQRRLSLACALFHRPSVIFVDEPTAGLDPVLRAKVWQHLEDLRDGGTTIFLTTQYIDEAQYCDRVAILNKGALIAVGEPETLRREALGGEALDVVGEGFTRADILRLWNLDCVQTVNWNGHNELRVMVDDAAEATPAVTQALAEGDTEVTAVRPYLPSFDEVFMELVQRK